MHLNYELISQIYKLIYELYELGKKWHKLIHYCYKLKGKYNLMKISQVDENIENKIMSW